MKPFRVLFGDSEEDRKSLQRNELKYPPRAHPVVRQHPVSGRKVLFVNPNFTIAIKNMDERESRSLLDTLFQQALIPEYQLRLRWAPHTIAMWDNRSAQHYAVHDYYPQRRYMERVTIRGGPVAGIEAADAADVRKKKKELPPRRRSLRRPQAARLIGVRSERLEHLADHFTILLELFSHLVFFGVGYLARDFA